MRESVVTVFMLMLLGSVAHAQAPQFNDAYRIGCFENYQKGGPDTAKKILEFFHHSDTGGYHLTVTYEIQDGPYSSFKVLEVPQQFKLVDGKMVGNLDNQPLSIDLINTASNAIPLPNGEVYPGPGMKSWCVPVGSNSGFRNGSGGSGGGGF